MPRRHRIRAYDTARCSPPVTLPCRRMPADDRDHSHWQRAHRSPRDGAPGAIVEFNLRVVAAFVDYGRHGASTGAGRRHPERTRCVVAAAAAMHDVVVVTAGSSAGERDYTVGALAELGEVLRTASTSQARQAGDRPRRRWYAGARCRASGVGGDCLPAGAAPAGRQTARYRAPPAPTVRARVPRKRLLKLAWKSSSASRWGASASASSPTRSAVAAGDHQHGARGRRTARPAALGGHQRREEVEVELLRPASEIEHDRVSGSHDTTIGILRMPEALRPVSKISATNVGSLSGWWRCAR